MLTVGDPQPDGTRTIFYELNGQPREVTIRDRKPSQAAGARHKADPANPGQVGAPIPGAISAFRQMGQQVKRGTACWSWKR